MTDHYYALILAGGGGTRLWPMSRRDRPKQMLSLVEEHSMFRISVERLSPLFPVDRIYIVTGERYAEGLQSDCPEIPKKNFILEPSARNNAAAVALALSVIQKRDPDATVVLLTADHHIRKKDDFRDVLEKAHDIAQDDAIVTLGISPTFPSTGFGYIRQGDELGTWGAHTAYVARQFTEKPDLETATQFLLSGEYSWNSGMFVWRVDTAMIEFERQQPDMYALMTQIRDATDTDSYAGVLSNVWEKMPETSIDFAIMEDAEKMAVIPVEIGWSDVGSWASLFEVLELDKHGNYFRGEAKNQIILDTKDTLVYSDRMIVTIGVQDVIVVDADDVIMVMHKDRAQDVKRVVNQLRSEERDDYL